VDFWSPVGIGGELISTGSHGHSMAFVKGVGRMVAGASHLL
jgi:hypothetical protein